MINRIAALILVFSATFACAQSSAPAAAPATKKPAATQPAADKPDFDLSAMLKETQHVDNRNGKIGIIWWAPTEYFEQSAMSSGASAGQARRSFALLQPYTLVIVGVGNAGFGNIDWISEEDVRKAIVLRDAAGNTYKPLDKVSDDAQNFADYMKPMMKNMLGPMGEGIRFVFFTNKDAMGKEFSNAKERGEFSLVVTDLIAPGASTYTWRLPLSSLSPPRYCPVGKERVEASWKYCPWHGNKLPDDTPAAPAAPVSK